MLGAFAGLLSISREGHAAGELGPDGSPLRTSNYTLDLYQGPVFAGPTVTGLAGAYVAISEGIDGDLQNPATPAVRPFYSYTYFDYWLGFGLTFPASLEGVDFFNSGSAINLGNSPSSFVFVSPAINLQWGELGVGATIEAQNYDIGGTNRETAISVTIPTTHLQFAHGLANNQLVLGVGARLLSMSVVQKADTLGERSRLFESRDSGLEVGAVYKPAGLPLRLGLAFRSAIRTEAQYDEDLLPNPEGDLIVTSPTGADLYVPESVALPWDVNFGFAVQFGRPLNERWRTSSQMIEREQLVYRLRRLDRARERQEALRRARSDAERRELERRFDDEQQADDRLLARALHAARLQREGELTRLNRFYVQIAGSMLISGAVTDGVGVESLLSQRVHRSGERAVVSPRLGLEVAVVPEWLKLRGGSYLEPTRFETSTPRVHGTFGLDVRLLPWDVLGLWPADYLWKLGLGADVASQYNTWGITIGGWYPRHRKPPTSIDQ
ncbi:MAG TPA: hypothetical protein VM686_12720 [Polyangiaceae bacterium]|nr:hypothetical protein [Polyangiaceae bacterium]